MTDHYVSPRSRDLIADARALQSQVHDIIVRFEDGVWNAGWSNGYDAGFHDGYQHALEQMRNAAQFNAPTPPPNPRSGGNDDSLRAKRPKLTSKDIVLGIIREKPGLRGVEIARLAENLEEPLLERTVRTALSRLRRHGAITNTDERWYIANTEPALDPQSKQNGESSGPA